MNEGQRPLDSTTGATQEDESTSGYARPADVDAQQFINSDANPEQGWQQPPEGHREADTDIDETVRRKG